MEFLLQPNIYATLNGNTLMSLLEKAWVKNIKEHHALGNGTFYLMSGFSNFNGGVRFYNYLEHHIQSGGKCKVILGGSSSQRMSSRQVVQKLLEIGCEVGVINRKAIFHAKCYGFQNSNYQNLIVSSGNFTSRGLTQNIEASMFLDDTDIKMPFNWEELFEKIKEQKLDFYKATLDMKNPVWDLLFDEDKYRSDEGEKDEFSTMIITLSHSDTARIQADPGTTASKGTQYFWLSKDCFDFFPPLNEKNSRGTKNAYQTVINVKYIDIDPTKTEEARVTFEAENNYDFRLGTGRLRNTKIADKDDIAAITRLSDKDYEIRIVRAGSATYTHLLKYATTFIGNYGKRYGYISNDLFYDLIVKI